MPDREAPVVDTVDVADAVTDGANAGTAVAAPDTLSVPDALGVMPSFADGTKVARTESTPPLLTLLLCLDKGWGTAQEQVLALACALQASGRYAVRVCCPADAALAERVGKESPSLPLVPVSSPRDLFSLFRLWRCQKRKSPLFLHSFDPEALQLAERLTRFRRPGSTILLHSCLQCPVGIVEKSESVKEGREGRESRESKEDKEVSTTSASKISHGGPMPTTAGNKPWQAVNRILCANGVLRSLLADSGLDVARLVVVHAGCDMTTLPVRRERGDGRFVFVAVEALHQGAGLYVLLRAMAALWQRLDLPPWEVRIVGVGDALTSILEEARSLGVESRLALLSRQELGEVLPRCDALLVPNRLPCGNMPSLLAAWCSGLPLVCTDIAPHREVVRANHSALYVPQGDAQALAVAMIRLMTDPALCEQLAVRGEEMREYASNTRVVTQTLAQYEFCLARRGWVLPVTSVAARVSAEALPPSVAE